MPRIGQRSRDGPAHDCDRDTLQATARRGEERAGPRPRVEIMLGYQPGLTPGITEAGDHWDFAEECQVRWSGIKDQGRRRRARDLGQLRQTGRSQHLGASAQGLNHALCRGALIRASMDEQVERWVSIEGGSAPVHQGVVTPILLRVVIARNDQDEGTGG